MTQSAARSRLTVLVTRPRQQSLATARRLHSIGHRAIIDPLLVVETLPYPRIEPSEVGAVLLTSANGAIAIDPRMRDLPVLAVGKATAAAATRKGSIKVVTGAGDALALAALVRQTIDGDAGPLIHLSGEDVRPGLEDQLREAGYDYRRIVVYRASPADGFSARTLHGLRNASLNVVMLYSPRTAQTFRNLIETAGLSEKTEHMSAICISDAVADEVDELPWRDIFVAARRDQEAMIACLESVPRTC